MALPLPPIGVDDLPDALARRLVPRLERLGYLGAFFAYGAHQPEALAGFVDFTEALKAALPPDLTEVVALSVADRLGNIYEAAQHERLSARLGFRAEWVAAVRAGDPGPLDARQRAVAELAGAMLADGGRGARPAFERVVALLGPADAIGVLLLIGRYVAHAHIANTLELTDPTGSDR